MSPRAVGTAQVTLAAIAWGTWSLFSRPSGLEASVSVPMLFVSIALFSAPFFRLDTKTPEWNRRTVYWLLAYSGFDAINTYCFFYAMSKTTVAVAVLTHYFAPVIVALLSPVIDKERVPGAVVSALLATLGLALVLEPWAPGRLTGNVLVGAVFGALSACGYAGNMFAVRRVAAKVGSARAQGYHAALSALLVSPMLFMSEHTGWSPKGGLIMLVGCLLPGTLAGLIFVRGLAVIGSARAAVLTYIEPLVAVLVGYLAFDEKIGYLSFFGAALILVAGMRVSRAQNASVAT